MSADDCYEKAGFTRNRGNAARLKANESIQDRVKEIKEAGASKAEIDRAFVLELIQDIIEEAREEGQYGPAMTGAVKLGVDIGMFEQRSQLTVNNVDDKSDDLAAARSRAKSKMNGHYKH
ncbi:MAG: hypothetical protein ACR2QF_11925 [Geminicoccaceae bacterium]